MTSLDKLLYEMSQGLSPDVDISSGLAEDVKLTEEHVDGLTIVLDENGKIKVSDNFVGNGNGSATAEDVEGLQEALDANKQFTTDELNKMSTSLDVKYSKVEHKHNIEDINELQFELDNKVLKTDFTNLKANFESHGHEISDIIDLQNKLDGKANINHEHDWSQIKGRPTTSPTQIDELVNNSHSHHNLELLNNLEDGNGTLIYNGNPLGEVAYLSVQTITERDSIPLEARKEGLMVLVLEDGGMYYLKGGTDNAFWEIFATGSGGAVNASTLPATPSGNLTGLNTQSLLDELESKKADKNDVYTKAETENFIKSYPVDYLTLNNLPDLSTLHNHDNKETLDLFSQYQGNLTWKGKTLGDLVSEAYDANLDGIIDVAQKLEGVNATPSEINTLTGATDNIQAQIDALKSGVTFKGIFPTYADMEASLVEPQKGDMVYIDVDETKDGAVDTQYVYDGISFVYGGGTTKTPDATLTTKGAIQLGGDLAHPTSTATAPKLTPTGVTAGLYKTANITIGEDGRITHAEEGETAFLNDTIVSEEEGWSSQKIDSELSKKSDKSHTHEQLHDKSVLGEVTVAEGLPNDKYVLTYDQVEGKAKWLESQGGKVFVGSKFLQGDYQLVGGSYISLGIDEISKQIVVNSTYREGGGNVIPTAYEILQTVIVPSGGKVQISTDSTYNKFMLHTVQMYNKNDQVSSIKIYNQGFVEENGVMVSKGWTEYQSNEEMVISDIVNIPIIDRDNSKMIHLEISNNGTQESEFYIRLKCTNLL